MRRRLPLACVAAILLVTLPQAVSAATVADLVGQVSVTSYRDYFDNDLYTHTGDDRGVGGAEHDLARDAVQAHFQSLGLATALDPFTWSSSTHYNVVGTLTGSVRPDEYIILGAHYDSVFNPGADDNASGVAAVMEAARVMSSYEFEATLVFIAFDREEQGLYGSWHYAGAHASDSILGMVGLDMVAYSAGEQKARVYGRTSSDPVKTALETAVEFYTPIEVTVGGDEPFSDHAPFEAEGFDAALLIEYNHSSNPNYHKSTDTVDTPGYIDYAFAADMTRGAVGWAATAAVLVPEPATLALMGAGTVLVLIARRRRA